MSGDGIKTAKPWWKSKTVLANIAVAGVVGGLPGLVQSIPITPEHQVLAVALANLVLRTITKAPLGK